MKIVWSPKATQDFDLILEYLQKEWGQSELESFFKKTIRILNTIKQNPKMFIDISKKKKCEKRIYYKT